MQYQHGIQYLDHVSWCQCSLKVYISFSVYILLSVYIDEAKPVQAEMVLTSFYHQ